VERTGIRYLGPSLLLVQQDLVAELTQRLSEMEIDFDVDRGSAG